MNPSTSPACSTSSDKFAVTLVLDRQLQRRLLLVPAAALACGFSIIVHLPITPGWRILAALVWCGMQGLELYRFAFDNGRFDRLRLAAHASSARLRSGQWLDIDVQPGSFVNPRFLWLRCRDGEGRRLAMLLYAGRVDATAWRRLQLLVRMRE